MVEGHRHSAIRNDPNCKICMKVWPPSDHFIGVVGVTQAYLFEDQYFSGWTVLVLPEHRTELYDLPREERIQLIDEVSRVGEALTHVFTVRKINSELLGNQVPHIHWHIIPRLLTDPDPLKPVWCIAHDPVKLSAKSLQDRLRVMRDALGIS